MIVLDIPITPIRNFFNKYVFWLITITLTIFSIFYFLNYYFNGLGLAYNDARSHLDIGRRVVESLKPGLAQLGSVWLPLTHLLMVPTVWNDFMWHSGLAGAIQSMAGFVAAGLLIYKILEKLRVGTLGRLVGVAVFVANLNVLYLQSTAMTELPLLATMTAGCYYLIKWHQTDNILDVIKSAFWIMLSSLIRYDGWFLFLAAAGLIFVRQLKKNGYKTAEGAMILFATLAGFGIALWFLWNQLIFKDALYFALGPFSARAQQIQLSNAGNLPSKYNLFLSTKIYLYALFYNSYTLPVFLALAGLAVLLWDRRLHFDLRLSTLSLLTPLVFNIIAMFFGFSVLFVQGISGDTWFNIRYGIMLAPAVAVFIGILIDRVKSLRPVIIGLLAFVLFFAFANQDAVTIDDARVGSSQKNVSEVASYLAKNAADQPGFILISVASHDAIIFSSGLPISRFIHEGTGAYWTAATTAPDRWARWIIMRTYDDNDLAWKFVSKSPGFRFYSLVNHYPFADVYEIDPSLVGQLHTEPVFKNQK
ncbi:MAG: Glycosyl transferase family 2 [Microgenomates group bacterium Gr01-1014_16]|nr:MAG: Glycosyl transferase family 2 [Microgenomates group bacterium Gr01-1014_16]